MLLIYQTTLDWIAELASVVTVIGRCDRNLADQLRRSSTAVVLNLAEGMGATGQVKTNCYRIALREMRESVAAIDVATRLGYVSAFDPKSIDRQCKIIGTLVSLARLKKK